MDPVNIHFDNSHTTSLWDAPQGDPFDHGGAHEIMRQDIVAPQPLSADDADRFFQSIGALHLIKQIAYTPGSPPILRLGDYGP